MSIPTKFVVLAALATPADASPSALDNLKVITDIAGTIVTAAAVIIGAFWAYFRFIRDRTYRPRLEVSMTGAWTTVSGQRLLHVRVTVKNIGASVVRLLQEGTGLRVQRIGELPGDVRTVAWEGAKVFVIFAEHAWIEPSEAVSDTLLMHIPAAEDDPILLETRLVWKWKGSEGNIVVFAREVVLGDDYRLQVQ